MARLNVETDIDAGSEPIKLRDVVYRYELRSGLSELFELSLELILSNPDFDTREVVGRPIVVRFPDEPFLSRVEGIVSRMRQLSTEATETIARYEIVVVPPLWLTTRRRDHRIFQDKTVSEIVAAVLKGYGERIPSPTNLTTGHPSREYTVQYGETDFDFICRILADDGISFFFDHDQTLSWQPPPARTPSSVLTLVDDTRSTGRVDRPIRFAPSTGALLATAPHLERVLVSSGVETSTVTLRDYDFERPGFTFESKAEASGTLHSNEGELEAYTYEVGQFTSADGKGRADQILEEARQRRDVYELYASFALAPGTRLTVFEHPVDHVNGEKLVTFARSRVSVDAEGKALVSHLLECRSAAEKFRPQRRPKPRIHGTQTAFVVGRHENQDEIDVDKYGRVKVRFTWDRRPSSVEGKPTRFIRVSQGWAGQGYGMVLLPRVGDELVVAYLDGDPDEPIAVGRVHNAVFTSPLNPAAGDDQTVSIWKSRSSPADKSSTEERYNMVRMQDKAGDEMLELRAQRDFHHETLHDSNTEVGHNQNIEVKGGQSTSAGSISMSSGSTITESAATNMTLTAGDTLKIEGPLVMIHGKPIVRIRADSTASVFGASHVFVQSLEVVVTGTASVTIKGPTVDIGGGAAVNVHADVINLNCK
jgi:type VI secretion system secreted protein VgrG